MAASTPESAVPDVLGPALDCVFCGINPGRVSAAAAAHFANPRNDFWRLLHDAGFTPRCFEPHEQFALLELGYGVTNAAARTTPGSGDLRRGDFDAPSFEARIEAVAPRAVAFVGKEAYRGLYGVRPELGAQTRSIGPAGVFVLPSTSPANAAVPYEERLRWFRALADWLVPVERESVRALVVDDERRVLLVRFRSGWWGTPGGGIEPGETPSEALARELREEIGLEGFTQGPFLWENTGALPWAGVLYRQRNAVYLVRVARHEARATIDMAEEGIEELRWWTADELERSDARVMTGIREHVRTLAG